MMPTRRQRRVAELVQEEISLLIQQEVDDPRVGLVTLTHVEVTPDLRLAHVYFSALDKEAQTQALKALNHASSFLRHELGARVRLRYTPELEFHVDHSLEHSMRIEELLSQMDIEEPSESNDT